jgi:hypothetical protein
VQPADPGTDVYDYEIDTRVIPPEGQ